MPGTARRTALLLLALLPAACDLPTGRGGVPGVCQQTYEFGNHGCARLLVLLEDSVGPLPPGRLYTVSAAPAGARDPSLGPSPPHAFASDPRPGAVPLELTLWSPLRGGVDTLSVWVRAQLREVADPVPVGVPLPVVAADSALRVLRFAPVGQIPRTDTVRLVLRRP